MFVHSKTQLTNVEKLAYLRHAIKDGPAVQAVEGLHDQPINSKKPLGVSKGITTDLTLNIKRTFVPSLKPPLWKKAMAKICAAYTTLLANIYEHSQPQSKT